MPGIDETKNYFRERKKEPSECALGTYRVKEIKEGLKITICKDKDCVKKEGIAKCPMQDQNAMYSKAFYKKDASGKIVPK
jgi:hypothetical protein